MNKILTQKSKYISYILRHKPEAIGLIPSDQGWLNVNKFLDAANKDGASLDRETLDLIVAENNKKRFEFSLDGESIRASQGHSITVDLKMPVKTPPEFLYHGTAQKSWPIIKANGLSKMKRHHVHLSSNKETAFSVGGRHGKPTILQVSALAMHKDGHTFYLSANNVWLTDDVPRRYISIIGE